MELKLHISSSPHIHTQRTTRQIMLDVIIGLLPTTVAGVVIFGARALEVIVVCIATAVLGEYVFNKIVKKDQTIEDFSAALTGLLLALNLPANTPIWQCVVGALFSIIIVKCFFGGLGRNLVNPAIAGRVFMLVSFGSLAKAAFPVGVDATSGATPLVELAEGKNVDLMSLFLGTTGGAIGETCALALIIGGIYLVLRKVITVHIPLAFVGTVFVCSLALNGFDVLTAVSYILSGGLLIGAIFMATDYVTSPSTPKGKIVFGIGAGLITVLIRQWGQYPEGVSFAILLMNILDPYIDRLTAYKVFGGKKE